MKRTRASIIVIAGLLAGTLIATPAHAAATTRAVAATPLVTAVSRSTDTLDVFTLGPDNKIMTSASSAGSTSYSTWQQINGGVAAPNTSVYAVSRRPGLLDAFVVGTDRHVYTAHDEAAPAAWQGWWQLGSLVVAPNTSVYAISRG